MGGLPPGLPALERGQILDGLANPLLGQPQLVEVLEVEPEFLDWYRRSDPKRSAVSPVTVRCPFRISVTRFVGACI